MYAHSSRPTPPPSAHLCSPQDLCEGGEYKCRMSNLLSAWDTTMGEPDWSTDNLATAKTKNSFPLSNLKAKYPKQEELESMLGMPTFDTSGEVTSAKAVKVRRR